MIKSKKGLLLILLIGILFVGLNLVSAGTCIGTADSCTEMPRLEDEGLCDNQEGCEWDMFVYQCGGSPDACSTFNLESSCTSQAGCSWEVCGNNIREGTEICDGTDLNSETCVTQGFSSGDLECFFNCGGFYTSGCLVADGIEDNLFIRLQGNTNSNSEVPYHLNPSYNEKVCISDFECIVPLIDLSPPRMACPPSYDIHMLSMDSPTGAQVGEFDLYDYKVCCKRTDVYQPRCDNGIVDDNEDCDRGLNCIMEGDNTCICPFGYNPYFPPDIQIPNDPLLNGCKATAGEMVFWSDDEDGAVSILEKNIVVGETMIYLIIQDITISDDTPMEFEIYERDLYSSQEIRTGSDALTITFSNYRAIVPWIITVQDIENAGQLLEGEVFEFYFTVNGIESGDLISTIIEAPPCDTKERCMDYTSQTECENDLCQVASNSMESIDCANPDIDCSCYWANNVCSPTWESEDIGKCWYTETTDDTCADMFLTYIWDAFWVNATPYLGDPQGLEALCVDGESTVPCPAQIKLSFFNHYNAVAAIVLIALIYFLMGLNKKKSKKKKKRK